MKLQGKVAIITGAGSGIGRASAQLFAKEGAKLVVADVNGTSGQETVKSIKEAGGEATFVHVDVSKVTDLEKMIKTAANTYGKLDILFSNAGVATIAVLEEFDESSWDKVVAINLKAGYFATKFAVREMRKVGGGSIIFTSSVSGLVGWSLSPVYNATKGGLAIMSKGLALALAPDHIRVNSICPGPVETPMWEQIFARGGQAVSGHITAQDLEEGRKLSMSKIPIGRFAKPQEIAYVALFLASDESSFITGVTLPVDGGFTAQ